MVWTLFLLLFWCYVVAISRLEALQCSIELPAIDLSPLTPALNLFPYHVLYHNVLLHISTNSDIIFGLSSHLFYSAIFYDFM
jgi:hypothetical protein